MNDQLLVPEGILAEMEGEVARLKRGIDLLEIDLQNAEMSLRAERRKVGMLKAQLEDRLTSGPGAEEVQLVFDYWRRRCRHPRAKLDIKRASVIRARLHAGHDLQDLLRAVDGAMFGAFVDEKGKRHDELELIMRDEVKFDGFLSRWGLAVDSGRVGALLSAYCLPDGVVGPAYDLIDHEYLFRCPVCRVGWGREDYFPLRVSEDGVVWCQALCVNITMDDVRAAIRAMELG